MKLLVIFCTSTCVIIFINKITKEIILSLYKDIFAHLYYSKYFYIFTLFLRVCITLIIFAHLYYSKYFYITFWGINIILSIFTLFFQTFQVYAKTIYNYFVFNCANVFGPKLGSAHRTAITTCNVVFLQSCLFTLWLYLLSLLLQKLLLKKDKNLQITFLLSFLKIFLLFQTSILGLRILYIFRIFVVGSRR